jgi:hypothetical protein
MASRLVCELHEDGQVFMADTGVGSTDGGYQIAHNGLGGGLCYGCLGEDVLSLQVYRLDLQKRPRLGVRKSRSHRGMNSFRPCGMSSLITRAFNR